MLLACAGVSNFGIDELAELLAMARIKPALVQRHSDPLAADAEVQAFCRIAGIQYQVCWHADQALLLFSHANLTTFSIKARIVISQSIKSLLSSYPGVT